MKVIFLDVDGVLNSEMSRLRADNNKNWMRNEVDFEHLKLLKKIVEETGAKIVLSSTWRLYHPKHTGGVRVTDGLVKVLVDKMAELNLSIMDVTPDFKGKKRGLEIQDWLDHHKEIEKYIIIDDDTDMLPEQIPFFVNTTFKDGLTEDLSNKAILILNSN